MKKMSTKKRLFIYMSAGIIIFISGFAGAEIIAHSDQHDKASGQGGDMGGRPWVLDIEQATKNNEYYRNARWTGDNLQMVLMSLQPGEVIDLEIHDNLDQFFRIEQGEARVLMGRNKDKMEFDQEVSDDWSIFIPGGYWHEIRNIGDKELKLYTIYAPAEHPAGTMAKTYEEAREQHHHEHDHEH